MIAMKLAELFAGINENAPIIVCGLLLIVGALFTVLMCADNARHKRDQEIIDYQRNVMQAADKEIERLRDLLKKEKSKVFAAECDRKRECKKRDARIKNLEHRVNQLVKGSD